MIPLFSLTPGLTYSIQVDCSFAGLLRTMWLSQRKGSTKNYMRNKINRMIYSRHPQQRSSNGSLNHFCNSLALRFLSDLNIFIISFILTENGQKKYICCACTYIMNSLWMIIEAADSNFWFLVTLRIQDKGKPEANRLLSAWMNLLRGRINCCSSLCYFVTFNFTIINVRKGFDL